MAKKLKTELAYYLKWVVVNHYWCKALYFISCKIFYRYINPFLNYYIDNRYYPKNLRNIIDKNINIGPYDISSYLKNELSNIKLDPPDEIKLASKKLKIYDGRINWYVKYNDTEEEESLHRWNWIIHVLSVKSFNKQRLSWLLEMQNDWVNCFQNEIDLPRNKMKRLLRWESYTIGERLSNSVILYNCLDCHPDKVVYRSLVKQAWLLTERLEYLSSQTSNHVCNNARALYLSGYYFQCKTFKELASEILFLELPKLITKEGYLREGSSHYQFLFTRWMLEVNYFARLASDLTLQAYLKPYLELLLKQCEFFLVKSNNGGRHIPLIGDISPDFSPEWLINMLDLAEDIKINKSLLPTSSWVRLWSKEKDPFYGIGINYIPNQKEKTINECSNSGWYRYQHGPFVMFLRAQSHGVDDNPGHHHQDAGHFCIYYRSIPILIDGGRLNYQELSGINPEAHNTLTINGLGLVPKKTNRFPKAYTKNLQSVEHKYENNELIVKFNSNGFSRIENGLIWVRTWHFTRSSLVTRDELSGSGNYSINLFFHFASGMKVNYSGNGKWDCDIGSSRCILTLDTQSNFKHNLHEGGKSLLGWQVMAYGEKFSSPTLEIKADVNLPAKFITNMTFN